MSKAEATTSFAEWAGLYVSGALLVVFVGAHLVAVHYAGNVMEEGYTFENVSARMSGGLYRFADLSLLLLALAHGLLGLHRFIGDLGLAGAKARRAIGLVLAAAGVWGLVYGVRIFRAFLS